MKHFLLGVAAALAAIVLVAAAVSYFWLARPPKVEPGTTLVLRLSGEIHEREPFEYPWPVAQPSRALTSFRIWDALRKASADKRIAALLVKPEGIGAGWAKMAEIRSAILEFRKTGKPVIGYLRGPSARDYHVTLAAESIAMAPGDLLNLKGVRIELMYARKALDKLGILPEFEAAGRFKDGADTLTRSEMSAETREVMDSLLDRRYRAMIGEIAKARHKTEAEAAGILDRGPFLGTQARAEGLIDTLQFEDEARGELAKRLHQTELRTVDAGDYQRIPAASVGLGGSHKLAVLAAEGDILHAPIPGLTEDLLEPAEFIRTVRELTKNKDIRAVILRIDSPGGDAIASDEMLHELQLLAKSKPVIVSMADVAASGGYALAMGGKPVIAYPDTITGSIGVFFGKLNLRGLYEKLGITKQVLKRGRFADIDSDVHALGEEEKKKFRTTLETVYQSFVRQVAAGRGKTEEEIRKVAEGRVWLGVQAKDHGLVDELGGIDLAIAKAKDAAGIQAADRVELIYYPPAPDWWNVIRQNPLRVLGAVPPVELASQARMWKRLPFGWTIE